MKKVQMFIVAMLLSVGCNNIKAEISSSDGIAACFRLLYSNSSYSKEEACAYLKNSKSDIIDYIRNSSKGLLCYKYLYQLCNT